MQCFGLQITIVLPCEDWAGRNSIADDGQSFLALGEHDYINYMQHVRKAGCGEIQF